MKFIVAGATPTVAVSGRIANISRIELLKTGRETQTAKLARVALMIPLAVVVIPFFSVMTRWGIPDAARVIVVFTVECSEWQAVWYCRTKLMPD